MVSLHARSQLRSTQFKLTLLSKHYQHKTLEKTNQYKALSEQMMSSALPCGTDANAQCVTTVLEKCSVNEEKSWNRSSVWLKSSLWFKYFVLTRRSILVASSGPVGVSTQANSRLSLSVFSAVHLSWLGQLKRGPWRLYGLQERKRDREGLKDSVGLHDEINSIIAIVGLFFLSEQG